MGVTPTHYSNGHTVFDTGGKLVTVHGLRIIVEPNLVHGKEQKSVTMVHHKDLHYK